MKLRAPSTSTAIASLALFVAMGGTSYAVAKLPKNSVASKQVVDRSLQASDLAPGVLSSGPAGARGQRGPAGAEGPSGKTGPAGVSQAYVDRVTTPGPLPNSTTGRTTVAQVRVPAGPYALDFSGHAYTSADKGYLDCSLEGNGAFVDKTAAVIGTAAGSAIEHSVAMSDALEFTVPTTVAVVCSQRGVDASIRIVDVRLRALRVGTLETQ